MTILRQFLRHLLFTVFTTHILTHYANAQTAAQCRASREQCISAENAKNVTAIAESCAKCFHSCLPVPRTELQVDEDYWSACLNICVGHDCVGKGIKRGATVSNLFRCKVYGRWCFFYDKERPDDHPGLRDKCGICAKECDTIDEQDRNYCEARCEVRKLSCPANPVIGKVASPSPHSSLEPTKLKPNNLWEWLGPTLGAAATIIGAIITVVWVRDYRHSNPMPNMPPPHTDDMPPPSISRGYDGDWPDPYGSTRETFAQPSPVQPSRFARLFGGSNVG